MKKMILRQKSRIFSPARWRRSVQTVLVITLLCGVVAGLMTSCTEEVEIRPNPDGDKVSVNFTLNLNTYSNDEAVESRSFKAGEPATDFVRVNGSQDVFLYATLEEEEPPVGLRYATTNLPDNFLVHIVAYRSDNTIENQATFKAAGGELMPVTNDLSVTAGQLYRFAAYSFGTLAVSNVGGGNTVLFAGLTAHPNTDLMWGITGPETINATGTESVEININHLFARVKVVASSAAITPAYYFKEIKDAHVNPHHGGALTLNVLTGSLSGPGPDATGASLNGLDKWSYDGGLSWTSETTLNATTPYSTTVESKYIYVFTNGAGTVALKIADLRLGDGSGSSIDVGAYELRFTKTLLPGRSYTLKLNFRLLEWAGSNIYWDTNRNSLYFLPTPLFANPPNPALDVSQGLQGVYFGWGSLVGVSPRGSAIDATTALYVPPAVQSSWTIQNLMANDWTGALQANIPRVPMGASLVSADWLDNHEGRNYLSEAGVHQGSSVFHGDICKYLSDNGFAPQGDWRMPNDKELQDRPAPNQKYQRSTPFGVHPGAANVNADGTTNFYQIPSYLRRPLDLTNTIFPGGGSRTTTGSLDTNATIYMTGSPIGSGNPSTLTSSYAMRFNATTITSDYNPAYGTYGLVRCVRLEKGTILVSLIVPSVDIIEPASPVLPGSDWDDGGTLGEGGSSSQGEVWY